VIAENNLKQLDLELSFSWGFDGSTGHSIYNMKMDRNSSDAALFATTAVPLKLSSKEFGTIWENPSPASPRFVRPLQLQFSKETKELVLDTKAKFQQQIKELQAIKTTISNDVQVSIKSYFHLTMIDGKCLAFLTGTPSMASCPLCQAKPSQLNTIRDFDILPGADVYGIQPLHFCICTLNGMLNLSYRLDLKQWNVGEKIKDRKKIIQARIKSEFNVHVDMPRDGGAGTSNTGNVARRLFENPVKLAENLELDVQMIKDFKTIMIALNCHEEIDPEKFQVVCDRICNTYRSVYPWARMTSAIHKVLYHAANIMRVAPLPLGVLSEEGGESKNKDYRNDRLHHARKIGRIENLSDIFHRSFEMSDPLISMHSASRRKLNRNKKDLPIDVQELLKKSDGFDVTSEINEEILIDLDDFEMENETEDEA
jgi:hypothetical protein